MSPGLRSAPRIILESHSKPLEMSKSGTGRQIAGMIENQIQLRKNSILSAIGAASTWKPICPGTGSPSA